MFETMYIKPKADKHEEFTKALAAHNKKFHSEILPTLLVVMGYDQRDVTADYDKRLWENSQTEVSHKVISGDFFGNGSFQIYDVNFNKITDYNKR